jgi:hypothetical protein
LRSHTPNRTWRRSKAEKSSFCHSGCSNKYDKIVTHARVSYY